MIAAPVAKPILDRAISLFEREHDIKIFVSYEASGNIYFKLRMNVSIDVVVFASAEWGKRAVEEDLVYPDTETGIGYQIILLYVRKDLLENTSLNCIDDLVKYNVRIGIADPKVAPGGYEALYIINQSIYRDYLLQRIVIAKDIGELTTWYKLGSVDAAFIWNTYNSTLRNISEIIFPWKCGYKVNIYYSVAYLSKTARDAELAKIFVRFMSSDEVKNIAREQGFFGDYNEVVNFLSR